MPPVYPPSLSWPSPYIEGLVVAGYAMLGLRVLQIKPQKIKMQTDSQHIETYWSGSDRLTFLPASILQNVALLGRGMLP